jgi:transcriptional regulator with XRE-family HTH domain
MDILRTLRKRKGYTVQQAADLIGVTRVTLHTWEGGQKAPKAPALQKAMEVYGATEDERAEVARLRAFGPDEAEAVA